MSEWLEDIKERFAKYQTDYNLNGEDVEWLIQQAELALALEKEFSKCADSHTYLEMQNKRYREYFGWIIQNSTDKYAVQASYEALEGEE